VNSRPDDLDDQSIAAALRDGWGFDVAGVEYAAVGFGSHHWIARDPTGDRRFVTVDELDQHEAGPDGVFARLRAAFDTAGALRDAGLEFVVAPLPSRDGATVRRLGHDYSVAVFPWVEGAAGEFGADVPGTQRLEVVALLAALHAASPPPSIPRPAIDQPEARATVEDALAALDAEWTGGPFAEPARAWLRDHEGAVRALIDDVAGLARRVQKRGNPFVVTHGEPHPGNVMRTRDRVVLIDWDTVALAPPERDLWSAAIDAPTTLARYTDLTGRAVDDDALALYRQAWDLDELAVYLHDFRVEHARDEDTEQAWRWFTTVQLDAPA
jgi:spectinomycin phosphotransferase